MFFKEVVSKFDMISPSILPDRYKKIVMKATSSKAEPTQSSHMHDVMVSIKKGGSLSGRHTPAGAIIHHIRQRLLSQDMIVVLKAYTLLHFVFRNANHTVFQRLAVKTLVHNPYCHTSRPSRTSWASLSSRTSTRTTITDESFDRSDVRYSLPIPTAVTPDIDPLTAFVVSYATYLSARLRLKAQADFPPVRCTDSGDGIVAGYFENADELRVIKAADELIATTDALVSIPFSPITCSTTSTMIHLRSLLDPTIRLLSRDVFLLWRTTCNTIKRMVSLYFDMDKEIAIQALNVYSRFVSTTARAAKVFPVLAKLVPRWRAPTHTISLDLAPSMREYVGAVNLDQVNMREQPLRFAHTGNNFEKGVQTESARLKHDECSFADAGLQDLLCTLPAVMHALHALFALGGRGFPKLSKYDVTGATGLAVRPSNGMCAASEVSCSSSSSDSSASNSSQACVTSDDCVRADCKKTTKNLKKKTARVVGNAAVSAILTDVRRLWETLEKGMERVHDEFFTTSGEETVRCLEIYTRYVGLCEEARNFFYGKIDASGKNFRLECERNVDPMTLLASMRKHADNSRHQHSLLTQRSQLEHHHHHQQQRLRRPHLQSKGRSDLVHSHAQDGLYRVCVPAFEDDIEWCYCKLLALRLYVDLSHVKRFVDRAVRSWQRKRN